MSKAAPKPFAMPGEAQARQHLVSAAAGAPAQVSQRNTHIAIPDELQDMPLRDLIAHSREIRMRREELDKEQKSVDEAITVRRETIAQVRNQNISPEDFDDMMNGREPQMLEQQQQ